MEYLKNRASNIEPLDDFLSISKNKKLRVKLGIDPTASDVTLGWYAILRMLRKFQEEGHTAVLILGEFTAQVGDPSGKSDTRNRIESKDVSKYSKDVLSIISEILHKDNLEIVSNKSWLENLTIDEMLNLASSTTLAQMMERDDFSKRYSNNSPISLIEFFYPLFQGYDSFAVQADIEIGGSDQLWNLMMGREVQKFYNMKPQIAVTFPLLIGTDGVKKMSQSFNNYISIQESPTDIFGKLMSLPDDAMWEYFKLLTNFTLNEISDFKISIEANEINPFDLKKRLGTEIIEEIFSKKDSTTALNNFIDTTIDKNIPDKLEFIIIPKLPNLHLPKYFVENNITKSSSEARRLINSGSVKLNGVQLSDLDINSENIENSVLQVGKRRFYRIKSI
jgi:tyrosyl-tRNA synthetase